MTKRRQERNRRKAKKKLKFDQRLVLTHWMLNLFGVATFEDLGKHMRDPAFEGFNEDGISRFHKCVKLLHRFQYPIARSRMVGRWYDERAVRGTARFLSAGRQGHVH